MVAKNPPMSYPPGKKRRSDCNVLSVTSSDVLKRQDRGKSEDLPFPYCSLRRSRPRLTSTVAVPKTHLKNQSPRKPRDRPVFGTAPNRFLSRQRSPADGSIQYCALRKSRFSRGSSRPLPALCRSLPRRQSQRAVAHLVQFGQMLKLTEEGVS